MRSFRATTPIAAPPHQVWATLLQTQQWADWDRSIERVEGELKAGGSLTLHVVDITRPFKLKVKTWMPNERIVLASGMPLGLFTGRRTYQLTSTGDQTQFTMNEEFSGPLAGMITKTIPDLQPSFDAFTEGLRAAAER